VSIRCPDLQPGVHDLVGYIGHAHWTAGVHPHDTADAEGFCLYFPSGPGIGKPTLIIVDAVPLPSRIPALRDVGWHLAPDLDDTGRTAPTQSGFDET
jgi:hypothetical protein